MIKLNLKQNAFHTLRHAIEHLALAAEDDETACGKKWDDEDECVVSQCNGRVTCQFAGPLARRPARYNLKFALQHLIQACELLLKAHLVAVHGRQSIADPKNSKKTISLYKALTLASSAVGGLLTQEEVELLFRANDLRNQVQHHEFAYEHERLRQICIEFLAICSLFSQKLFGVNLVTELMFDPWVENSDPVGEYLCSLAEELSSDAKRTTAKIAADWLARNPDKRAMLCICCGSRAFMPDTGFCTACGAEGDEDSSRLVEELEEITNRIVELRASGRTER